MKNGSNNVARATKIMLALGAAGRDGMSLSELAEHIGDAKPSIHRALISMGESGFVTQRVRRGNYFLGPAVFALAQRTPSVPELVNLVRPRLLAITAETGLSSFLMMRAGLDSICIDMQPGRLLAPSMIEGIGGRLPLGVGLAGVVLLGQLDTQTREQVMRANADAYASHGISPAALQREIDGYRANGYASGSRQGAHFMHLSIGFPVMEITLPGCEAAISVLAPDYARSDAEIAEHAQRISALLEEPAPRRQAVG